MAMVRVTIDDRVYEVEPERRILDVLGTTLPALCHDPRVAPAGVCRLCLVEVHGLPKPVPACTTAVHDGMRVATRTVALEAGRREILEMLAERIPAGGADRVTATMLEYGITPRGRPNPTLRDESHPYMHVDMTRCIDCFLCERICHELQGQDTWHAVERNGHLRLVPDTGLPLGASSCVSCGACADACPSGAIEDRVRARPLTLTRTTCPYCGVGCELEVGTREDQIVQIRPALDAPVNKGHLCVKGRYAFGFVDATDRVTTPLVRDGDRWRQVSWDEAIETVAMRLARIRAAAGPDAIGVLGSARATNEDNYIAQKFARVVLGTNNVDCCARVCHAPSAAALATMFGTGAATSCYDDIERAATIVVVGANSTESHPIVGDRIRQAARRGACLIVIDPLRSELAESARVHLRPRIGTDIPLLHAIAATVLEEDQIDRSFVETRVTGLDELRACVAAWPAERAATTCGVEASTIRAVARQISRARPTLFFHGLGVTEHVQGTETVMCIANLALLTGNIGVPGAGVNPLRGQNNVQGAAHMGCEPGHLTGYAELAAARARFEHAWSAPISALRGLDLMEMIDAADRGELKALWAIGYDVQLTNPEGNRTRRALSRLDMLVVQDMFLDETAREHASVFLPATSSFEKDGTFMNAERRVQRVRAAVTPRGQARADWQIVCDVARAMGHPEGFAFHSPGEIWDEIRQLWPAGAGMSYARLERGGLQWPCPSDDHPGTPRLHQTSFARTTTATLHPAEYQPGPEQCDSEFPFLLTTGRRLYQFNAGTMTRRTANIVFQRGDVVEISASDAARHELRDGDVVRLRSRHGEAVLPVSISGRVRDGELFATFHTGEVFLNRLIGPARDAMTDTPGYKRTAVRIERDDAAAKLAFLRASHAFDGVLEVIETHMSWVFLTERHAFKLKKPVHLPFVDYRTLERRRQSCANELRLGRRLASSVYDAVVPLIATPTGLAMAGAGEVVDWLVVMRRLPRNRMLPEMLAHGEATAAHADAVGDLLAAFYGASPRTTWDAAEYRRRLSGQVRATGEELADRGASRAQVDRIVRDVLFGIEHDASALDARIAGGYVVDAHGDLRPEHVCLETPPVIIDPLELDDDLRTLDTASELAFFALECERIGATWFAERVLARYMQRSGDPMPSRLRQLYRAQHALTRGLIALRHVEDAGESEQPRWRRKAEDYLARATTA